MPKSQLPADRSVALAWWVDLTIGERQAVAHIMKSLMVPDNEVLLSGDSPTMRSQLSHAYAKAAEKGLFGTLFDSDNKKRGEKRLGLILLYFLAHGLESSSLYHMIFSENLGIVRLFWEAMNSKDLSRFESFFHQDFEWVSDTLYQKLLSLPEVNNKGPDMGCKIVDSYCNSFLDLRFIVGYMFASGSAIITRLEVRGTQIRDFMGLRATDAIGSVHGCAVHTIADNKVCRLELFWDSISMLQQLGLFGVIKEEAIRKQTTSS